MKDQINRLARGEFVYETPKLTISIVDIEASIQAGSTYCHEFKIVGSSEIKGVVYSNDYRVTVDNSNFIGVENLIKYTVDLVGVEPSEIIDGQFDIISNADEISIPYSFKVIEKEIETSMGKVHNLFHFANMAQMASEEAQKLFVSKNFPEVFLKNDLNLLNIYESLNKGENIRNNIEEFLIAIHKKSFISLSLSEPKKIYKTFTENYKDVVVIRKHTWGYIELNIASDSEFIKLSLNENNLNSEIFTGNKFELEYLLDKSKMHHGKNFGRIIITSTYQELIYEIEVNNYSIGIVDEKSIDKEINMKEKKRAIYELSRKYIDFRAKRIDVKSWIDESNHILDRIRSIADKDIYFRLVQAQIYFTQQKIDTAQWLLDSVKDEILQQKAENVTIYCYYLYVNSLIKKDTQYSQEILKTVKKYYENGHDEWQLLWIMFYIDEEYDKNQSIKLARIKEQFHKGYKSPILYLEASNIINAQPMLLRVLNDFELQVINFACKYNIINEKLAQQICEICKNEKSRSKTFLRILNRVYNIYNNDQMLNVLCTNLIRNEISGPNVFEIYEQSILKNFRITKLYEFYMDSIDESKMKIFPKMVLLYFAYNNQLDYDKKAFLYANIITNKEKEKDTYSSYRKQIELFAIDQIRRGRINENLIIIYKDIWDKSILNKETAETISKILFTYKLTCHNDKIKFVIVKHKELLKEIKIPFVKHVAYIQMYTENCSIVFEDEFKVRKKDSISFEIKRLFEDMSLVNLVYDENNYDLGLLQYFCEGNRKYQKHSMGYLKMQNYLNHSNEVTPEFKRELRNSIIHYYYLEYIGDEFEQNFPEINTENLTQTESSMLIETCIMHGMYEDAYDLTLLYGYRKVKPQRLFKLCRRMIEITDYNCNEFIIGMSEYVFLGKKYDDVVLEYLVSNFNGTTKTMLEICDACYNFNIDAHELEERLISQMIFSNSKQLQLDNVFEKYYERGAKDRIVEAYLAYNSYNYFVKEKDMNENVFKILENRMFSSDEATIVCEIALLKYYSTIKLLEEKQLIFANKLLDKLCTESKIFSFFKKFENRVTLPFYAMDKTIIEFRTNPNNKVTINYITGDKNKRVDSDKKDEYVKETMKNTFEGVFTKEFTMLYGDTLEYYFTVIANGSETSTDNKKIIYDSINTLNTNGRFDFINDMLASKELHDMATLHKLMHGYCVQDYVTGVVFKPL
ncbi:DUF5717 family protein [[Clostridium] fimetarium]|uniref:Uncharacterized protein n=1 Tax=[Clostridium] fimetarium TaxID=99656 RepID=A0A1I0RUH6_9FIRM|nr:DUF5717 family protein [[Clostridium] fimetarium]SEW45114.1 hypothetical protein SAMN05421659_12421 [[Clostridium] fimetarium]